MNADPLRIIVPDQLIIWVAVAIGVFMGAGVVACWWACASGWHQERREDVAGTKEADWLRVSVTAPEWAEIRKGDEVVASGWGFAPVDDSHGGFG